MWVTLFMADNIFPRFLSSRGVGLIQGSSDSDKYLWRYEFILIIDKLSKLANNLCRLRGPTDTSIHLQCLDINTGWLLLIWSLTSHHISLSLMCSTRVSSLSCAERLSLSHVWKGGRRFLGLVHVEVLDWCTAKSWTGARRSLGPVHGEVLDWCMAKSWTCAWWSLGLMHGDFLDWCTTKSWTGTRQSLGLMCSEVLD